LVLAEHPEEQRRLGRRTGLDQVDELAGREGLRLPAELLEFGLALRDVTQQGEDGLDGRMGTGHRLIVADGRCAGSWISSPAAPRGTSGDDGGLRRRSPEGAQRIDCCGIQNRRSGLQYGMVS